MKITHYRFKMLQLLLHLPGIFSIKFQSSMTIVHYKNARMQIIPNFISNSITIMQVGMTVSVNYAEYDIQSLIIWNYAMLYVYTVYLIFH